MWSRRDQIQAYQFVRRRTVSAVVLGDANSAESPVRRVVVGLLAGTLCLVLLLAGFGVYGVLRPGNSSAWRQSGAIVEEKETGARFVLGTDGALHPVLNYASARLITGGSGKLTRVSRRSLAAAARGVTVGIAGAPDALPAADRLVRGSWLACSSRPGTAGPGERSRLSVILGPTGADRRIALGPGTAVVVRAGGRLHVLTDGRRFRVPAAAAEAVLAVLGLTPAPRVDVDERWLSTVPAGPDLDFPQVPGRGARSAAVPSVDTRVGQVVVQRVAASAGTQFFLVLADGLAPVSSVQARLLLGDPRTAGAYPGTAPAERVLAASAFAAARRSAVDLDADRFPRRAPEALTFPTGGDVVLCGSPRGFAEGLPAVALTLGFAVPAPAGARPVVDARRSAQVFVPPGTGAVVRGVSVPGVATGPVHLVTDEGRRYALPDPESRSALGYGSVQPDEVPARFVGLLPAGPALDRAAAARFRTAPG